ncbi:MAG: ZIP family metal transporter [Gemmatimonadaceae bacterium]|nr:ZIP family metal transporter [Gemmatimonadaceae bacterium]
MTWSGSLAAVALISAIPMAAMMLASWRASRLERLIPRLVPIAAGALAGAAFFHLIPESLAAKGGRGTWLLGLTGFAVFLVVDRLVHRASVEATTGSASALGASGLLPLAMAGDALHNVIDGMLIAAAYLGDASLGILTAAAIALHELPRELGTFAILVRGGMSVRRALAFNALTAAGAVAGALATLTLGTRVAAIGTALVPFAAGTFVYLAGAIARAEYQATASRTDGVRKLALALIGLVVTAVTLRG